MRQAGLYAAAVVWAEKRYPAIAVPLGPAILSLLGIILGLLLVFRTNTAYDRWWEGRRLWGQLVNVSRALARQLDALLGREGSRAEHRERYVALLTRFPTALAIHLRGPVIERHEPTGRVRPGRKAGVLEHHQRQQPPRLRLSCRVRQLAGEPDRLPGEIVAPTMPGVVHE
jgi:hypothetical protein